MSQIVTEVYDAFRLKLLKFGYGPAILGLLIKPVFFP